MIYFFIPNIIDSTRALFGPLPRFVCLFDLFVKNVTLMSIGLHGTFITIMKYLCFCVYKSMPMMDDNFLSFFFFLISHMISMTTALIRICLPGRPVLNELICVGHFYPQWYEESEAIQSHAYVLGTSLLTHIFLSYKINKSRIRKASPVPNARSVAVNLGDNLATWVTMFWVFCSFFNLAMINGTNPEMLDTAYFFLYSQYFFVPVGSIVSMCFVIFGKNASLRKSFLTNWRIN